jgi:hypothetical protein
MREKGNKEVLAWMRFHWLFEVLVTMVAVSSIHLLGQCTVYSVQCTVFIVQCTVYNVQFTVYSE